MTIQRYASEVAQVRVSELLMAHAAERKTALEREFEAVVERTSDWKAAYEGWQGAKQSVPEQEVLEQQKRQAVETYKGFQRALKEMQELKGLLDKGRAFLQPFAWDAVEFEELEKVNPSLAQEVKQHQESCKQRFVEMGNRRGEVETLAVKMQERLGTAWTALEYLCLIIENKGKPLGVFSAFAHPDIALPHAEELKADGNVEQGAQDAVFQACFDIGNGRYETLRAQRADVLPFVAQVDLYNSTLQHQRYEEAPALEALKGERTERLSVFGGFLEASAHIREARFLLERGCDFLTYPSKTEALAKIRESQPELYAQINERDALCQMRLTQVKKDLERFSELEMRMTDDLSSARASLGRLHQIVENGGQPLWLYQRAISALTRPVVPALEKTPVVPTQQTVSGEEDVTRDPSVEQVVVRPRCNKKGRRRNKKVTIDV